MTMFVFIALFVGAVIGVFCETVAIAVRQLPPEQVAMEETGPESSWAIAPDYLRMW